MVDANLKIDLKDALLTSFSPVWGLRVTTPGIKIVKGAPVLNAFLLLNVVKLYVVAKGGVLLRCTEVGCAWKWAEGSRGQP